jgi:uridine phosphorylase
MAKKKSGSSKPQANVQPHIKLSESSAYERVLVCGAPERAEMIASYLKDAKL